MRNPFSCDENAECKESPPITSLPNSRSGSFLPRSLSIGAPRLPDRSQYKAVDVMDIVDQSKPLTGSSVSDNKWNTTRELCLQSKRLLGKVSVFNDSDESYFTELGICKAGVEQRLLLLLESGSYHEQEIQRLIAVQEEITHTINRPSAFSAHPSDLCSRDEFFVVFLNSETLSEMQASHVSIDDYAYQFGYLVSTADSAPPSRSLDAGGVGRFFDRVAQGQTKVVGFNEFAYSEHGQRHGNDRLIEREYWIKVKNDPMRVILHVHYLGCWNSFLNRRDRSLITAANLRHAVPKHNPVGVPVFHEQCKAFRQWREKRKFKLDLGPGGPWDWQRDRGRHPQLHDLLMAAERCARRVRSIAPADILQARRIGARHALIIAVDQYPPPLPRLGNPVRDGCNLESVLLDFGWEVPAPSCLLRLLDSICILARLPILALILLSMFPVP